MNGRCCQNLGATINSLSFECYKLKILPLQCVYALIALADNVSLIDLLVSYSDFGFLPKTVLTVLLTIVTCIVQCTCTWVRICRSRIVFLLWIRLNELIICNTYFLLIVSDDNYIFSVHKRITCFLSKRTVDKFFFKSIRVWCTDKLRVFREAELSNFGIIRILLTATLWSNF